MSHTWPQGSMACCEPLEREASAHSWLILEPTPNWVTVMEEMEVEYQITPESLDALRRVVLKRVKTSRFLIGILYIALVGIPPSLLFLIKGSTFAVIGGWVAVLACVIWALIATRRSMAQILQSFLDKRTPRTRLKISPALFVSSDDWGWSRRGWSTIHAVDHFDGHVMVFINEVTAHVISDSDFSSPGEARRFTELAEQYRQAALQGSQQFQAPPAPKAEEHSHLQVSFRPSPADKLAIMHDVDERRGQDLFSGKQEVKAGNSRWLKIVCLIGFIILIAYNILADIGQKTVWGQALHGVFVTVAWGAFVIFSVQSLRYRLARRTTGNTQPLTTVTIAQAGLLQTTESHESFSTWQTWEDIRSSPSYILFCPVKQHIDLIIPKRAFATPAEADHFFAVTKEFWELGRHPANNQQMVELVREDDGNPFRSPLGT
ncbi:MAG: hypothetical protein MPJ50_08575 [Pirellulales bacterium]|nr:hypothetical protein [Pirellulales bacterium]